MAISKSQKGVEAFVTINGVPAKEYIDALNNTEHEYPAYTVSCLIESVLNASFAIVVKVHPKYKLKAALEFRYQVDQHIMPVGALFVATDGRHNTWTCTVDGKKEVDMGGGTKKQPFRFSEFELVDDQDDDRVRRDKRAAPHLGELKISVFRQKVLRQTRGEIGGGGDGPGLQIAEKAVKGQALSHGTAFGNAMAVSEKTTLYVTKPSRGRDSPCAVFIFRYRSRETLQHMGILPRAPTPDILDSFTREELREMARGRKFGKQEEQDGIKRERSDDGVWNFTNDDEVLTIDMTGDEVMETRVRKRARVSEVDAQSAVDLTED